MSRVAVVYASRGGQTSKIASYISEKLQERGHSTQLIDVEKHPQPLASEIDCIIYGSPVYRGKFLPPLLDWVKKHHQNLTKATTALFVVCLNSADKHPEARAADKRLLQEFMQQTGWVPDFAANLAGALKYRDYPWYLRLLMKRISAKAGGDLDTSKNYEYTDWSRVDAFLSAAIAHDHGSDFYTPQCFPEFHAGHAMRMQEF